MSGKREHWGSQLAFILAAAGSAIGLGNIWKFPYVAGANGGAAFVLVYLFCVFLIGAPIMICEMTLGRNTQRNPVGAFRALAPGGRWWLVGLMGIVAGFIILSYYSVIAGWTLEYTWHALMGDFNGLSGAELGQMFTCFTEHPIRPLFWHLVFMGLTMAVVLGGIQKGVGRCSEILMPTLFALLVAVAIFGIFQTGWTKAMKFYLAPDFGKFTITSFLSAMGQAFFSLSLGMGAILTYGSYLEKNRDIVKSGLSVVVLDTLIALLAGLAIFPVVFSDPSLQPTAGPGLLFISLPTAFANMTGGWIVSVAFFLLVVIAALTSSVSLLEVVVTWLMDERGWERGRAVKVLGLVIFLCGLPTVYSITENGAWTWPRILHAAGDPAVTVRKVPVATHGAVTRCPIPCVPADGFRTVVEDAKGPVGERPSVLVRVLRGIRRLMLGKNFFDFLDFLTSNVLLPLGGLLMAVFMGWKLGMGWAWKEIEQGAGGAYPIEDKVLYGLVLKYVAPLAVAVVLIHGLYSSF